MTLDERDPQGRNIPLEILLIFGEDLVGHLHDPDLGSVSFV